MDKKYTRRGFFAWMLALVLALGLVLPASWGRAAESFTFLVLGDSRTEPYCPGGREQEDQIKKILYHRYHVEPSRLEYDQDGNLALVEMVRDQGTYTFYYREGWPRMIIRSQGGQSQVLMRDQGRKWVMDRVVAGLKLGQVYPDYEPRFCVHGGDFVLNGYQGASLARSPYWQLVQDELLSRLPPPDDTLGLPGRVLGAVGNHETWDDPNLVGMLETLPWLGDLGLSSSRRIYAFAYRNTRFIFLDSGGWCPGGTCWKSSHPPFAEQMAFLQEQLRQAVAQGARHVFVIYHKPSFVQVGHDPLPPGQNPHPYLKPFASKFNLVVFNSHAHTTEHYRVDGINYLVLGGGGAPMSFRPAQKPSTQEELYWQGGRRVEEYSYLRVEVDGPRLRGELHRFRPAEALHPFSTVEMFNLVSSRSPGVGCSKNDEDCQKNGHE